jgi:hypothetical protein
MATLRFPILPVLVAATASLGLVLPWALAPAPAAADDDGGKQARQLAQREAARALGRRVEDVALSDGERVQALGRSIRRFKVMGEGAPRGIDVDEATGQIVDGAQLIRDQLALNRKRDGKTTAAVKAHLRQGTSRIPVVLWLNVTSDDSAAPLKEPISGAPGARRLSADEAVALADASKARRASETAAVRARMLQSLVAYDRSARVHESSPVAYATVQASAIAALEAQDDVIEIDLDQRDSGNDLANASATLGYRPGVHTNLGLRGTGIKIGQVEGEGTIPSTHPCLNQITQGSGWYNEHAAAVAGVLICEDPTRTGAAPDASLYFGGGVGQSAKETAMTAAKNWGARAINLSYWQGAADGIPDSSDRFVDEMFFSWFLTMVKSAGNDGPSKFVSHPGNGYNVITVGNFDDKNSPSRADDSMASNSSGRSPLSNNNDRIKPEVAAPGVDIETTNTSGGFVSTGGTSFAAPFVTGTAALMMQAANLQSWPEIIKAGLMATAVNVVGASRLSTLDGAGGIDALAAVSLVKDGTNGNYKGAAVTCTSFPWTHSMFLQANRRTRVAIVWHQDPTYPEYVNQPSSDLDLQVKRPDGTDQPGAWSGSYDNTYELAEFTPAVAGTFKAEVSNFRCERSPRYIGLVWYQVP